MVYNLDRICWYTIVYQCTTMTYLFLWNKQQQRNNSCSKDFGSEGSAYTFLLTIVCKQWIFATGNWAGNRYRTHAGIVAVMCSTAELCLHLYYYCQTNWKAHANNITYKYNYSNSIFIVLIDDDDTLIWTSCLSPLLKQLPYYTKPNWQTPWILMYWVHAACWKTFKEIWADLIILILVVTQCLKMIQCLIQLIRKQH